MKRDPEQEKAEAAEILASRVSAFCAASSSEHLRLLAGWGTGGGDEQEGAEVAEVYTIRCSAFSATSCSERPWLLPGWGTDGLDEQEEAEVAEVLKSRVSAFSAASCSKHSRPLARWDAGGHDEQEVTEVAEMCEGSLLRFLRWLLFNSSILRQIADLTMRSSRRCLPAVCWGSNCRGQAFDAFAVTDIRSQGGSKDVRGCAA